MAQQDKIKMSLSDFSLVMKLGLQYVGMWPDAPSAFFCRCVWILTTTIMQICQYWYLILHFGTEDLSDLTDALSVAVEYTVVFTKLIILWFSTRENQSRFITGLIRHQLSANLSFIAAKYTVRINCRSIFNDVLALMATEWREATVNEVHIMTDKASQSRRFSNLSIGINTAAAISYGMNILMQICQNNVDEDGTPIREFTLKLQLPFEYIQSPRFELVQGIGWIHQLSTSAVNGMLNSLVITLVFYMGGQIEILCDALKDLSPGKYNHRLASSVSGELVVRHQKIITFSDKIEKIFCYIALMQFMSSTLVICCLGYMMMSSISNSQDTDSIDSAVLMKAMMFYMAATLEAFIYCFCGEYLSAKSKMIGDAAYESLWYDLKTDQNKFILLIILSSQRRLTITAGKMMDLSLEGFTTIIKASVSYISVLHAMS